MTRPIGAPILWASNETIDKPGHPSDGTPTKVKPSTGMIEAGYVPDVRRPAVVDNWKEHDLARRLLNLDMAEALNWIEPAPNTGSVTITGGNGVGGAAKGPGPDHRLIVVHNVGDALYASYDGGYSWAADIAQVGTINYYDVASCADSAAAVYDDGTDGRVICYGTADATWTSQALTTCPTVRRIVYDPFADCYYVGGATAAPLPTIRRLTNGQGIMPMVEASIVPSSPGDTNPIQWIACSPDKKIAASYASGTNTSFFYSWENGNATFANMADPPVSGAGFEVKALLWLPEDELFLVAIYISGGDETEFYVNSSTLPGSWTLVASITGEVQTNSVDVLGSLVVGSIDRDGRRYLCVSGDAGTTWDLVPDPVQRHQGSPTPECAKVRAVGNRFMAMGYKAAGEAFHALSFRAGRLTS